MGSVHVFGLTGGIASGKSVVASRFRRRGLPVLDADAMAREVVQKGSPALEEIAKAFGGSVLLPDGSLDRKALAAIAFANPMHRKQLEAITHPRIHAMSIEHARELAVRGEVLACYDAALLVENGIADAFRPLVVVSATEELQVARTVLRDGCTVAEAFARVRAQMPLGEKVAMADYVLENTGTLEELEKLADAVLDAICRQVGVAEGRFG